MEETVCDTLSTPPLPPVLTCFDPRPRKPRDLPKELEEEESAVDAWGWRWEEYLSCTEGFGRQWCGESGLPVPETPDLPKCPPSPQGPILPPGVTLDDLLQLAWREYLHWGNNGVGAPPWGWNPPKYDPLEEFWWGLQDYDD